MDISGDSLNRHLYSAMLQILTDNFADGQLTQGAEGCQWDEGYSEARCRDAISGSLRGLKSRACPSIHLPGSPFTTLPFAPNATIPPGSISEATAEDMLNVRYHHLFRRGELDGQPFEFPAQLSVDERLDRQRRRLQRRHEAGQLGSDAADDTLYSLPAHIGALVIDNLGYHDLLDMGGLEAPMQHYEDMQRLFSYLSEQRRPVQPVWPLYASLHVTVAPVIIQWEGRGWREKLNDHHTRRLSPTIARMMASINPVDQYYPPGSSLSYTHYDALQLTGRPRGDDIEQRWSLPPDLITCDFTERVPGTVDPNFVPLRQPQDESSPCCHRGVRPWQTLDMVRLTSEIPFSWTWDGTHWKQYVNLYKAQAILNFAHLLVQQQQQQRQL